ncbi:efflux RND transporter periplasmic adaptor subunit [Vibrio ostreicida]|uniref:efflux RND transporter periplasmic adaptor subunit n=1 Tax=Vibrio ostreicida TaxID=526588 RepID=UPI003B59B720
MKTFTLASIALLVGGALGYTTYPYLSGSASNTGETIAGDADQPLYWVAPMDPNYQRDKPGKSPMGMDLIPIYAEDMSTSSEPPGTIKIDPSVENNLGVKRQQVTREPLSPRIETVGYVAFDESQLWQTNVRVAGWVEKLNINAAGETIGEGDVLFTLYSPELVKAQEELINAYQTGRASLVKGATERLVALGVDREQIKTITTTGKASQTIDIKAPASGVIASLGIREGGYLSPAQTAISAGPLDHVWVDAEVFERQSQWIQAGSNASMTLDSLPGEQWQGTVDYIYPILDPNTRTLRVRLKFPNPDGKLKPNMFANIALEPVSQDSVLTIPRSAVIRSGGMTRVVLSKGQGKYRSARIETGREAADKIEVLQGLTVADSVVTSAHFMLDSESSQSADLSRINGLQPHVTTVWGTGEITEVMADQSMITINHQPIPEWDWPGMVMNFNLAHNVNIASLSKGQNIQFEIQPTDSGQYQIVDYKIDEKAIANTLWLDGDISVIMADFGMITIRHQPVPDWGWNSGEMNFSVDDNVDLSPFTQGETVRFLVEKQGTDYLLKDIAKNGDSL